MVVYANENNSKREHFFNLPTEDRFYIEQKAREEKEKQKYLDKVFEEVEKKHSLNKDKNY